MGVATGGSIPRAVSYSGSSIGRAAVSKTAGWWFDSIPECQAKNIHIYDRISPKKLDIILQTEYNNSVRKSRKACKKGSEDMNLNVSEALLRAILELIDKCDTLEELRESVKRIVGEDK